MTRLKRLNRRTRSTGTKSALPSESKNALSVIQSAVTLWPKLTTAQDRPFIHRAPAPNARHPQLNRKHPTKNSAAITVAKTASNQSALNGWINHQALNTLKPSHPKVSGFIIPSALPPLLCPWVQVSYLSPLLCPWVQVSSLSTPTP